MKVPFIDLSVQYKSIQKDIQAVTLKVMRSQKYIMGEHCQKLENRIAAYTGVKHALGVASGTDALYVSLLSLEIGAGDEVITTPFTFFATAGAISRVGAKPVFVDIDPVTFNINPMDVKKKITSKTKAILPVHLFGLCSEMPLLKEIAKKQSLYIIEDGAQSFGAEIDGQKAGAMGDLGCLSFYPTKNLAGAGDGGMILTSSDSLANKVKLFRDHGSSKKYHHDLIGTNSRLDELQAAVLAIKLKYIDKWNAQRIRHAADYSAGLKDLPLRTPFVPHGYKHVFHIYSVVTTKRDALQAHLLKQGVHCGVYYPLPVHLQVCYKELGYKNGDLPESERTAGQILALPMYPELTEKAKKFVIQSVRRFFKK